MKHQYILLNGYIELSMEVLFHGILFPIVYQLI